MKRIVISISLFLLGTTFCGKAQEMTPKEKAGFAIGIILGEKIKSSGIDLGMFESIKEKLNGKIDFKSIRAGLNDILKGESKLSKEDIMAVLTEF